MGLVTDIVRWAGAIKDVISRDVNQQNATVVRQIGQEARDLNIQLKKIERVKKSNKRMIFSSLFLSSSLRSWHPRGSSPLRQVGVRPHNGRSLAGGGVQKHKYERFKDDFISFEQPFCFQKTQIVTIGLLLVDKRLNGSRVLQIELF